MKIIKYFDNQSFVSFLEKELESDGKFYIRILTWEDGDGFLDLCDEDGGLKNNQLAIFESKEKVYKFTKKIELLHKLQEYIELKSFSSVNGMYKLGFEIYIFNRRKHFVLCPELNTACFVARNFMDCIFGNMLIVHPWEKDKFHYSEKQESASLPK